MFNKIENLESPTKRAEKKSTFFQKSNFKTLNHYFKREIAIVLFLLSAVPLFAENAKTATGMPHNIIFNGGFELGKDGFSCKRYRFYSRNPEFVNEKTELDAADKVQGKCSLKIPNPRRDCVSLMSMAFTVDPRRKYSLSVWMKSDASDLPVTIKLIGVNSKLQSKWSVVEQSFKVSTAWKRYAARVDFKTKHDLYYMSIQFPGDQRSRGDLWIDVVQLKVETNPPNDLEKQILPVDVKSLSFNHAHAIEGAVRLERRIPLYFPMEEVKGVLRLVNHGSMDFDFSVTYTAVDDYGTILAQGVINVKLKSDSAASYPFSFPCRRAGAFTIVPQVIEAVDADRMPLDIRILPRSFAVVHRLEAECSKTDFSGGYNMSPFIGVDFLADCHQDNINRSWGDASFDEYCRTLARSGCRWARDWGGRPIMSWYTVEEQKGVFQWEAADRAIDTLLKHGINPVPVLGWELYFFADKNIRKQKNKLFFPDWVVEKSTVIDNPQRKGMKTLLIPVEDWEDYVRETARHFKGRITHFEIFNEPNLFLTPEQYLTYLKAAYRAIKSVDSKNQVVGFSATGDFGRRLLTFLDECFALGGLKYCDAVSFHPYDSRLNDDLRCRADTMVEGIRELVRKHGGEDKNLWDTELFSWDRNRNDKYAMPPPDRPARRFLIDLGEGVRKSICVRDTYYLFKPTLLQGMDYYKSRDVSDLTPSAIFVVYNTLAWLFEGAEPVAKLQLGDPNASYVFRRKNGKLIAAFWNIVAGRKTKINLALSSENVIVMDLFGNKTIMKTGAKGLCITFGNAPVYIENVNGNEKSFLQAVSTAQVEATLSNSPSN